MADKYLQSLMGSSERVLLIARQHTFILLSSIAAELSLSIALLAGVTALAVIIPLAAFGYALLILPLAKAGYDYLTWRQLKYVITNRRVVRVSGLFSKTVTDSSLDKVSDVQMSQSFFGRLFDYGDIKILTASEMGVDSLQRVAHPVRFKTAMLNAREQRGQGPTAESGPHPWSADIPELIAELDALRVKGVITEQEFQDKKRDLLQKM